MTEEITAATEAAEIVETVVTTVDVESAMSFLQIYMTGMHYATILALCVAGYIVIRHLMYDSLRFNYRYYLEYGEFVILWPMDGEQKKKDQIQKIIKENNIETSEFVSWLGALIMGLFVTAILLVVAVAWPLTIVTVVPPLIVRGLAYRKRQKINFTQKLKGDHLGKDDGSV